MMLYLVYLLVLGCVSLETDEAAVGRCTKPGYQCIEKCGTLLLCIDKGQDNLLEMESWTCDKNSSSYCNETAKDCSGQFCMDENWADQPFECMDIGIFPDPYNCSRYYSCFNMINPGLEECPNNMGYNPYLQECVVPPDDPTCTNGPLPTCTSLGQTGANLLDPHYFYFCDVNPDGYLYPYQFACSSNLIYDPNTLSCVEHIAMTSRTEDTTTDEPTTTTTEPTTTTTEPTTTTAEPTTEPTTTEVITTTECTEEPCGAVNLSITLCLLLMSLLPLLVS